MAAMTLENILAHWAETKPTYDLFCEFVSQTLKWEISDQGVFARFSHRTKDEVSLAKKLYKKGISEENYFRMSDKAGIRIVCRFKKDLAIIAEVVNRMFLVTKKEDKSTLLDVNESGYRSLHFDIKIKPGPHKSEYDERFSEISAEVQVRTLCEDVWAEINHDIGYKPMSDLPSEHARQIYCLGGLLEVADDSFMYIQERVESSSVVDAFSVLSILEPTFIKYFKSDYQTDFYLESANILIPLLSDFTFSEFKEAFREFVSINKEKIDRISRERKPLEKHFPYITQPEILLIYFLVERNIYALKEQWKSQYEIEDLRKMCLWWGTPLDDVMGDED